MEGAFRYSQPESMASLFAACDTVHGNRHAVCIQRFPYTLLLSSM
jgi:hypothetical protein